ISRPDVLSLLGRALFFRFLTDRQIITEDNIPHVAPGARTWHDCFDGPANAAATCRWLDDTFNGDFLPLAGGGGEKYFRQIDRATNGEVFRHLMAVGVGGGARGAAYQLLLKLECICFAPLTVSP